MNESLQQVLSISLTIFSFVGHLAAFKLHFTLSFTASTSGRYTGDQNLPSLLTKLRCYLGPFWKQLVQLSAFSFQLSRRPSKLSGRNPAESNVLHCKISVLCPVLYSKEKLQATRPDRPI